MVSSKSLISYQQVKYHEGNSQNNHVVMMKKLWEKVGMQVTKYKRTLTACTKTALKMCGLQMPCYILIFIYCYMCIKNHSKLSWIEDDSEWQQSYDSIRQKSFDRQNLMKSDTLYITDIECYGTQALANRIVYTAFLCVHIFHMQTFWFMSGSFIGAIMYQWMLQRWGESFAYEI